MVIYPKIPVTQFYGNPCDHDTRNIRVEQGRGGVVDRGRKHWLNPVRKTYQIKAILKDRDELQTFLETNRGLPFEFRYDGTNNPALFICKSHRWEWMVYTGGEGVWSFSGNFEQVYRPGWVPSSLISTGFASGQGFDITLTGGDSGSISITTGFAESVGFDIAITNANARATASGDIRVTATGDTRITN